MWPWALAAAISAPVEAAWGQTHQDEMVKIISDANHLPADVVLTSLRRGPLAVEPLDAAAVARQQAGADTFADLKIIPAHIDTLTWKKPITSPNCCSRSSA